MLPGLEEGLGVFSAVFLKVRLGRRADYPFPEP